MLDILNINDQCFWSKVQLSFPKSLYKKIVGQWIFRNIARLQPTDTGSELVFSTDASL